MNVLLVSFLSHNGPPLITLNLGRGGGGGCQTAYPFHCVLQVQIACKIAYVINGRPATNIALSCMSKKKSPIALC